MDPGQLAEQASGDDDHQRAEEEVGEHVLAAWLLASGDHRGEEDAGGQERRDHPEDRQLHVPGAHDVEGQEAVAVEAEEPTDLGPVVLAGHPDQRLDEEHRRHRQEEPGCRLLRRGERHPIRCPERQLLLVAAVPTEPVPPSEHRQQRPDADERGR